jgi:hypothetical protein
MHGGYNEKEKCQVCCLECWAICVDDEGVCRGCKRLDLADIDS